jgi:sterol desaturase/sphingolipid hydroxylase (fatty acid hydroxylase superfamily)
LHRKPKLRLFKNAGLELISITPVWLPAAFWLPVTLYLGAKALVPFRLEHTVYLATGLLAWTIFEYILHRFVFHHTAKSMLGKKLIFIIHENHHAVPNDSLRALFPPAPAAVVGGLIWCILRIFIDSTTAAVLLIGFIAGYCTYDYLHFSFHHIKLPFRWWVRMRQRHLLHHAKGSHNFGVSNAFWDYIFRTNAP